MRPAIPRRARLLPLCILALGALGACEDHPPEPPPGWWRPARGGPLTEEQRAALERLETVGYVGGSRPASGVGGVVRYDRERTAPGLNLYTSGHAAEALLVRSDGTVVHRWARPFRDTWPASKVPPDHPGVPYWRRVHLFDNGDLLAIHEGLGLVKLDRDSRPLWAVENGAHHDLDVRPDGEIWVLTRQAHLLPRIHATEPILEDFITILDADGRELRRLSLLEAFERSDFERIWYAKRFQGGDMFHTNTLEVLGEPPPGLPPAFRAGNVLTSMRHLDAIAVVDPDRGEVVWAKRGGFRRQHDPTLLANGRLLLFDNDFASRGSSVLELDPVSMETRWEYRGADAGSFYSEWCGTAQRLPNGNTLITESDAGRVFEVTREGEIVWEFLNPHRAGPHGEWIAAIFEMVRLPPGFPLGWTEGGTAPESP